VIASASEYFPGLLERYNGIGTESHWPGHYLPPLGLRLLGEPGYEEVGFEYQLTEDEFKRIADLFPEADIYSGLQSPYERFLKRGAPQ
jgi:hypothetical protein